MLIVDVRLAVALSRPRSNLYHTEPIFDRKIGILDSSFSTKMRLERFYMFLSLTVVNT